MSLPVADLARSRTFYEVLGFTVTGGDDETWSILRNGDTTIGLFHGMFDEPILTFNPGLGQDMSVHDDHPDVREIEGRLRAAGIEPEVAVEGDEGPGHCVIRDPDGNQIMFDQFS